MKESTQCWIVIGIIASISIPLATIMLFDMYDMSKRSNYYETSILNRLKNETCSELNASRSIYDPAFQGELLQHETIVDQAWKEKCS